MCRSDLVRVCVLLLLPPPSTVSIFPSLFIVLFRISYSLVKFGCILLFIVLYQIFSSFFVVPIIMITRCVRSTVSIHLFIMSYRLFISLLTCRSCSFSSSSSYSYRFCYSPSSYFESWNWYLIWFGCTSSAGWPSCYTYPSLFYRSVPLQCIVSRTAANLCILTDMILVLWKQIYRGTLVRMNRMKQTLSGTQYDSNILSIG